jgi:hypothetical protein
VYRGLLNTSVFLSNQVRTLINSEPVMAQISAHHLITGMVDAKTNAARQDIEERLLRMLSERIRAEAESPKPSSRRYRT